MAENVPEEILAGGGAEMNMVRFKIEKLLFEIGCRRRERWDA